MFPIPFDVLQAKKPPVRAIITMGWVCALPPSAGLILPSHQIQPTNSYTKLGLSLVNNPCNINQT